MLALVCEAVSTCDAVIVVYPTPVRVTRPVVAFTVATFSLELEYVKAPSLLELGAVNKKDAAG